jgi:hypothetical protein
VVDCTGRTAARETINIVITVLSCPALQLESSKPQRERFRHTHTSKRSRHAEKARRLADLLREQRKLFPGFAARIDQFIAQVESDAHRTRKSDRDKVISCLRAWSEGLRVTEIMDDTGLSHWDVRQILNYLVSKGRVEFTPRIEGRNLGNRPRLYRLKVSQLTHTPNVVRENPSGKV